MLDSSLISKYYYLLYQKELDEQKVLKVVTSFYKPYVNDNIGPLNKLGVLKE